MVMRWSGGDQQGRATHSNEVSTALTSREEANAFAPSAPILRAHTHKDQRKCERSRLGGARVYLLVWRLSEVTTALTSRAEANAFAPSSSILGAAHTQAVSADATRVGQCSRLPVLSEVERG